MATGPQASDPGVFRWMAWPAAQRGGLRSAGIVAGATRPDAPPGPQARRDNCRLQGVALAGRGGLSTRR